VVQGQLSTEEVNVAMRTIRLRSASDGTQYTFGNAPVFNRVWLQRPLDTDRLSTDFTSAATRLQLDVSTLRQILDTIWEFAVAGGDPTEPDPISGPGDPIVTPGPGGDDPILPEPPGGQSTLPTQQMSALSVTAIPVVIALLRSLGFQIVRFARIPWAAIPGWAQRILVTLGAIEGADFILDLANIDIDLGIGGGDSGGDPIGKMVEAMTVSTWEANGVTFHRLSDGRLATRKKTGVWTIWRPKKPLVIFTTGATDLQTLLKVDKAVQKQAKKIAKVLRNRGFKVSRT